MELPGECWGLDHRTSDACWKARFNPVDVWSGGTNKVWGPLFKAAAVLSKHHFLFKVVFSIYKTCSLKILRCFYLYLLNVSVKEECLNEMMSLYDIYFDSF